MNVTVRAALETELATIEQLVDQATPFRCGTDLSCEADLDPRMLEVDRRTTLGLVQAVIRRLDSPRGELLNDSDHGIDIRGMLNRGLTAAEIRALPGQIRSELEKDDRIASARVTLAPNETGSELRLRRVELAGVLVVVRRAPAGHEKNELGPPMHRRQGSLFGCRYPSSHRSRRSGRTAVGRSRWATTSSSSTPDRVHVRSRKGWGTRQDRNGSLGDG